MTDLTFRVKNLGVIKAGEFIQKPLTIFCGPNNSGKTWAMYSLYHYYYMMAELANLRARDEIPERDQTLAEFNKHISKTLMEVFNTSPELLKNAGFE